MGLYTVPRECIHDKRQKNYKDEIGVKRRLEDDTEELEDDTEERVLGSYDAEFCTACANNWVKYRGACKAQKKPRGRCTGEGLPQPPHVGGAKFALHSSQR